MSSSSYPNEPIAIIGSGCRFPGGASSPLKLWDLLRNPIDVSQQIGSGGRFNHKRFYRPEGSHNGTSRTERAYLLNENVRHFDTKFFSIPPGEAEAIDPQQRILLEVIYEALERAGLRIGDLSGSDTACYVGIMCQDFFVIQAQDLLSVPKYAATGIAASNASSRVSYFFDWHGPSMTIDTACSSSMVCVSEAVNALRSGSSQVAIACGTNLLLSPFMYVQLSNVNMVSPTGYCHMWDESADGYARGEGAGCLVLKTLSAAIRDGDNIACVIREVGLNHDGRTKGLTMPSAEAQAALIRETYKRAGLDPTVKSNRCQFFEAHGTGTPIGDPRESEALDKAFFPNHDAAEGELVVGSVKTIIGHTEGCAGIAGILKAALAVQHAIIPPNLHFKHLNPALKQFTKYLRIPTECEPWPEVPIGQPRRCSVNSFGFGGANAHCILESHESQSSIGPNNTRSSGLAANVSMTNGIQKKETVANGSIQGEVGHASNWLSEADSSGAQSLIPFVFSAISIKPLVAMLESMAKYLEYNPDLHLPSLAYTLSNRRSALALRLPVYASSADQLRRRIEEKLATDDESSSATHSVAAMAAPPSILAIFTGQGAQWPAMGSKLVASVPMAKGIINILDNSLSCLPACHRPNWTLAGALSPSSKVNVGEAAISQPLCTAVQILLVDLLFAAGVRFRAVVGHSSGEIAAAYAAGFIKASDAIRIAYYRGYFAKQAAGPGGEKGGMFAVGTNFEDANELCLVEDLIGRLGVAAHNSPSSVTLSGDVEAVNLAKDVFDEEKKFARALRVDTAYHSNHMERCAPQYLRSLGDVEIQVLKPNDDAPKWFSTVYNTEMTVDIDGLKGEYWIDNMVRPVLFYPAIKTCLESIQVGFNFAIEVGPHPALQGPAKESIMATANQDIAYSGTLRRACDDVEAFADALGNIWTRFGPQYIDLGGFQQTCRPDIKVRLLPDLPSYPWTHDTEYWVESKKSKEYTHQPEIFHDLLGLREPDGLTEELRWRQSLSESGMKWLSGHKLQGQVVFPATGYICMVAEAALLMAKEHQVESIHILDLEIRKAIALHQDQGTETIISLTKVTHTVLELSRETMTADFSIFSVAGKDSTQMVLNCCGTVCVFLGREYTSVLPERPHLVPSMMPVDINRFYQVMSEEVGLDFDGAFRGLTSVSRRAGYSTATARNHPFSHTDTKLLFHPAMLDCGLQALNVAFAAPGDGSLSELVAPTYIRRITLIPELLRQNMTDEVAIDSVITDTNGMTPLGDVDVYTQGFGHKVIEMEGIKISPMVPPAAATDRFLFQESVMCLDSLDARVARGDMRLTKEEVVRCYAAERVAFYYLRQLVLTTSSDMRAELPRYRQCLLDEAERVLDVVKKGEHRFASSWINDTKETIDEIITNSDGNDIDLSLAQTVGENLLRKEVLSGEANILQYMTRNNMLERYYTEAIGYSILNYVGTGLMEQLCHKFPRMRILEVGAGTGSATASILNRIGEAYSSYMYTDISGGFFERASERFQAHAHKMDFKTLDITKDPASQGFELQGYDVVVATNVLHATTPLTETLRNARRLLKPGGYFINMELAQSDAMRFTLVVGCLPGWWVGEDDGRKGGPLLTPAGWDKILAETGFAVDTISEQIDREDAWVAMAARAVDEKVAPLIKPLDISTSEAARRGKLLVIGGTDDKELALREQTLSILSSYFIEVTQAGRLHDIDFNTEDSEKLHVLMLTECDANLWEDIDEAGYENLKLLVSRAATILWVLQGSQDVNPHAGITLGFLRTLYYELPDTKLQTLDIGDDFDQLSPNLLAECVLRLRGSAEIVVQTAEQERVLWNVEPELFMKNRKIFVPRLKCDKQQNARYNSARRAITHQVDISTSRTSLALVWDNKSVFDTKGSYVLREQHELKSTPQPPERDDRNSVTIRLSCSFLSSLKTPAGFFFVCLGTDVQTGSKTLCFSDSHASIVTVPSPWAVSLDDGNALEDAGFISFVVADLLAQRVVQLLPPVGSVVIFDANPVAQALLLKRLVDRGKNVVLITSRQNSESASYLHPKSPKRVIEASLPCDTTLYIDASDDSLTDSTELGAKIAAALSDVCEKIKLSKMTAREASVLPQTAPETLVNLLHGATSFATMFSQLGPIPIAGGAPIDVLPLAQVLASETPNPNSLVHWEIDKYVDVSIEPVYMRKDLFRPDRTYWLAGLSGSLGRSIADFLASHNAKHVVLSSRNPKIDQEWVGWHRGKGVNIAYFTCDVTDYESVKETYSIIRASMPPIGGVASGAMVLRDATFVTQRFEDWKAILRPKVLGTINLDRLFTADASNDGPLDWFIGFSSLVAYAGNPGQAAYGAGNCFLKAFIRNRHNRGLAGSTIDIGRMVGVGYIESQLSADGQDRLKFRSGTRSMSESDLHQLFAEAVVAGRPNSGLNPELTAGINLIKGEEAKDAVWYSNPKMGMMIRETGTQSGTSGGGSSGGLPLKKLLKVARTTKEAVEIILSVLRGKLQGMKFLPNSDSSHDSTPLVDMGIDSLVAVYMRSWFQNELSVDVPVMKILGGASMAELVASALDKLPPDILGRLEGAPKANGTSEVDADNRTADELAPKTNTVNPATVNQADIEVNGTLEDANGQTASHVNGHSDGASLDGQA